MPVCETTRGAGADPPLYNDFIAVDVDHELLVVIRAASNSDLNWNLSGSSTLTGLTRWPCLIFSNHLPS